MSESINPNVSTSEPVNTNDFNGVNMNGVAMHDFTATTEENTTSSESSQTTPAQSQPTPFDRPDNVKVFKFNNVSDFMSFMSDIQKSGRVPDTPPSSNQADASDTHKSFKFTNMSDLMNFVSGIQKSDRVPNVNIPSDQTETDMSKEPENLCLCGKNHSSVGPSPFTGGFFGLGQNLSGSASASSSKSGARFGMENPSLNDDDESDDDESDSDENDSSSEGTYDSDEDEDEDVAEFMKLLNSFFASALDKSTQQKKADIGTFNVPRDNHSTSGYHSMNTSSYGVFGLGGILSGMTQDSKSDQTSGSRYGAHFEPQIRRWYEEKERRSTYTTMLLEVDEGIRQNPFVAKYTSQKKDLKIAVGDAILSNKFPDNALINIKKYFLKDMIESESKPDVPEFSDIMASVETTCRQTVDKLVLMMKKNYGTPPDDIIDSYIERMTAMVKGKVITSIADSLTSYTTLRNKILEVLFNTDVQVYEKIDKITAIIL